MQVQLQVRTVAGILAYGLRMRYQVIDQFWPLMLDGVGLRYQTAQGNKHIFRKITTFEVQAISVALRAAKCVINRKVLEYTIRSIVIFK